ncbi:hypothetical protein JVT61DRAFT_672 [Boletus reticuloceps]|uniref:Uncharacterized protein n=1 Tax=Boletus reticuloceps TaxID=495285 RepID=A0A8I3AFW9_9AGAM|nr:hypothetical protein JVT61DRAFT_672 [Boletus reticuloceps]
MYAAKFTVFYVIATLAALASASPVPVASPDAEARAARVAAVDVVVREPLPIADVEARICRRFESCY